jgi:hypothetical protein
VANVPSTYSRSNQVPAEVAASARAEAALT